MATKKQTAANRENAKRSTGPRTQAGKSRSSMNSRKHALLAKTIVIDGEDPAEFEDLLKSLVEEFNPNPGCEYELVFLLATDFWRLRRIPRFEARSLCAQQSEIVYRDPRIDRLIEDEIMRSNVWQRLPIDLFASLLDRPMKMPSHMDRLMRRMKKGFGLALLNFSLLRPVSLCQVRAKPKKC